MFTLAADPQFTHRVSVAVPVDGGYETQTMQVRYRVMPVEEAASYDLTTEPGTAEFLGRIVVSVEELIDDDGEPVLWCDRVRDALFGLPHARLAIVQGYFAAVSEARRKN